MIQIKYPEYNKEVEELEERLKGLSLAYKMEKSEQLTQPSFEDGLTKVEGMDSIKEQLDKLQGELFEWWYGSCVCD